MKRLILANSGGGISITVDIEVVPPCVCRVYLYEAITPSIAFMETYI